MSVPCRNRLRGHLLRDWQRLLAKSFTFSLLWCYFFHLILTTSIVFLALLLHLYLSPSFALGVVSVTFEVWSVWNYKFFVWERFSFYQWYAVQWSCQQSGQSLWHMLEPRCLYQICIISGVPGRDDGGGYVLHHATPLYSFFGDGNTFHTVDREGQWTHRPPRASKAQVMSQRTIHAPCCVWK